MTRHVRIAHKLAPSGSHKRYRMAAIVVRGGAIISTGVNQRDRHAEHRALKPHRDYRGAVMVVARENGGCSRPCDDCMAKLRKAGIVAVTYQNYDHETITEKL